MKNFKRVFEFVFSRALIFALAFIWCRYYISSLLLSVAAALGVTFAVSILLFLVTSPHKRKAAVSAAENELMDEVINQFVYSANRRNIEYFFDLVKREHPATLLPDCIITENNNVKTLMFTRFTLDPVSPDEIRDVIIECRRYGTRRAVVFGTAFSDKAKEIAEKIEGIEVVPMDKERTYGFIKEFGLFPAIAVKTRQKKRTPLKVFFKFAFSRAKTKAYLFGAAVLLIGSLFVRYNLYYLISATAFLFFALISFINFKFKAEPEKSLL